MPANDDGAFIESAPPPLAVRGLAGLIIALFVVAAVGAVVVDLPETVSTPFVLMPVHGGDPLRAPRAGTVTAVEVAAGQAVAEGAALVRLRSQSVRDQSAELRALETQVTGAEQHLRNAEREHASDRRADEQHERSLRERVDHLQQMVRARGADASLRREVAQRYRQAQEQGFSSWEAFVGRDLEARDAAMALEKAESELVEAEAALERLGHEREGREAKYAELTRTLSEQVETSRIRIAALRDERIGGADELGIAAPCNGTVLRRHVNAPGAFVEEGALIVEIACNDAELEAELRLPQAGIGRVRPAQRVKLLYDAFPYQRFGVRNGEVRWVSPAGALDGEESVFRALAHIDDTSIVVDGKDRPLVAGMTGEARIVVGQRSVVSYVFDPIRQLRESVRDAPPPAMAAEAKE